MFKQNKMLPELYLILNKISKPGFVMSDRVHKSQQRQLKRKHTRGARTVTIVMKAVGSYQVLSLHFWLYV